MADTPSGWYTDPTGNHAYRYWDGSTWTSQVSDGGATGTDPTELDPQVRSTPPAPGTGATEPASPPPTVQVTQTSGGGGGFGFGAIVGVLIALLVIVIVIFVIVSNSGDDAELPEITTTTVATTEAP